MGVSAFQREAAEFMDDEPYSAYGLRPVEITDRQVLNPYFASLAQPLSDYTFSQLYTWRNSLQILWTVLEGHLCVFANGSDDLTMLMPPIGDGRSDRALAAAFELMDDYNAAEGVPDRSRVEYASEELLARCGGEGAAVRGCEVRPMGADYVYDVRRMIDLAGGDLASKRQAKNRFTRNYEYRVEHYVAASHETECRRLLSEWKQRRDAQDESNGGIGAIKRIRESKAAELTLACAAELGIAGMVVRVRGGDAWPIAGFTFGELLGADQSSIIIEKTDLAAKGLAQFIFSEFCRLYWSGRPLVNVGDDWGLPSLAWTKMSYRPVNMLRKFCVRKSPVCRASIAQPSQIAETVGVA